MGHCKFILYVTLITLFTVNAYDDNDCQDGWSSCESSVWVTSRVHNTLSPYTPGESGNAASQEYEIKFTCRGRRNGYYADLDHSCKVWHYCNTTREVHRDNGLAAWTYMHYSYICSEENTRYDQVLRECVPESKSLVRCQDSESYYPTGDYVHHIPALEGTNNRLVPLRCPNSDVPCTIQDDHINLKGCPESPGSVIKFYSSLTDLTTEAPLAPTVAPVAPVYTPSVQRIFKMRDPSVNTRVNLKPITERRVSSYSSRRDSLVERTSVTPRESKEADFLGLPYGSTAILGDDIDTSFDCKGRSYGYYADVKNQCKVYHVCSPKLDEFGVRFYEHYSFVCAEGLIFDQQKLTCVPSAQAYGECAVAEKLYHRTADLFNRNHLSREATDAPAVSSAPRPRKVTVLRVKSLDQSPPLYSNKRTVYTVIDKMSTDNRQSPSPLDSDARDEQLHEPVERYSQTFQESVKDFNQQHYQRTEPHARKTHTAPRFYRLKKGYRAPALYHSPLDRYNGGERKKIAHSPSVLQSVRGPHVTPNSQAIAHNPSVSQYIASPPVQSSPASSMSHNPTISQYIGGAPNAVPSASISHSPNVDQYSSSLIPSNAGPQAIVHSPSIHQVIVRPEYSRPSSRLIH